MTTLAACTDHGEIDGLEIDDVRIVGVDELCLRPKSLIPLVPEDETQLVVAIHPEVASAGAVQAAVRRLGFDPLSVGIVDLDANASKEALRTSVLSSLARTAHYPGGSPGQVKLLSPSRTTRRGLLSMGAPSYTGAPKIVEETCVASEGCRFCADSCPAEALVWEGGSIRYDLNRCVACGICLTSCPTGSVANPSASPMAIEAEIAAAIDASSTPVGIRYHCRGSVVAGETGWYQVEVPCTGMLTLGWLLTPLILGANATEAVPCIVGGCPLGNDQRLAATLADFDAVSRILGLDSDGAVGPILPNNANDDGSWLGERSTLRVIQHLTTTRPDVAVALESADTGSVSIDAAACTACQICTRVCPTGALTTWSGSDGVHIAFDPRKCVACAQCVTNCPEIQDAAITLKRGFDTAEWASGPREIRHEPTPLCELCGKPVAPVAMLSRIESMLGQTDKKMIDLINRRCIDCRGR